MTKIASDISAAGGLSNDEKRLFREIASGHDEALGVAIPAIESACPASVVRLSRALLFAVHCDALSASKQLVRHGARLEVRDQALWRTPLIIAGSLGSTQMVGFLLEAGADVHAEDDFGNTALCVASETDSTALIELLIAHGSDPEHRNDLGWTPLISASAIGNLKTVNALIKQGANLESRAVLGWTPLIVASQSGSADVVSRLLELGARRDAIDCFGRTALLASQEGQATTEILMCSAACSHAEGCKSMKF
ncbi:ankyrin repeat domain-containing protein [Parasedimentitalea marina]|uniref:Ankyrin repeat domain-containing protein n=1 Tax=Parasedimentitalea marina TaxID=2483033 RepID=A0A3T0N4S2_9RHOB|nr:ankyrin repeat domain-containing protein [Parasedimentitalea marina]AZV79018.1 ankyrin repeat domain-containing protein [Parasedimentitalea marina]